MANGIPPFLPASPPPMCKLDYYEDDDDEFGDFSNAGDSCYLESNDVSISKSDEIEPITKQVFDPGAPYDLITNRKTDVNSDGTGTKNESNSSTYFENLTNGDNPSVDNIETDLPNDEKNSHSIVENGFPIPIICSTPSKNSISDNDNIDFEFNPPEEENCDNDSSIWCYGFNDGSDGDQAFKTNSKDISELLHSNTIENSNFEQTEPKTLTKNFSTDSDDSNIPEVRLDCFISGPEIEDDVKDEINDFGDSAESNFFNTSCTVNDYPPIDTKSFDSELMTIVTSDKIENELHIQNNEDIFDDDDFSDFVTVPPPPKDEISSENDDDFEPFEECFVSADSTAPISDTINPITYTSPQPDLVEDKPFDLSTESWNEFFRAPLEDQIEVNLNSLEGKLNSSSVWCKIKDIESSPALSYNWNNSETNKVLLSALYVDSRNILFGPRWNSEVPRFASNLGFSPLVPEKASSKNEAPVVNHLPEPIREPDPVFTEDSTAPKAPSIVPEAHFDWNNSGLTNPLDSYSHSSLLDLDLLANFDIHSPYYKKNRKEEKIRDDKLEHVSPSSSLFDKTPRQELSEEAKEVLNNLPNLLVMEKQYIVFPVS